MGNVPVSTCVSLTNALFQLELLNLYSSDSCHGEPTGIMWERTCRKMKPVEEFQITPLKQVSNFIGYFEPFDRYADDNWVIIYSKIH